MAATARKADYRLRLVQIKLRKNVCKSLWTKCGKHQQLFDSRDAYNYTRVRTYVRTYNHYIPNACAL